MKVIVQVPNLVGAFDHQVPQQIGVDRMIRMRLAEPGSRINSRNPHLAHVVLHGRPRNAHLVPQQDRDLARTQKRMCGVDFVDAPLGLHFLGRGSFGLVIQTRAAQTQKLSRAFQRQLHRSRRPGEAALH